jgi:hypothetical protein
MLGQHFLLAAHGTLATTECPPFAVYLSARAFVSYSPRVPSPVVPNKAEVDVILMTL